MPLAPSSHPAAAGVAAARFIVGMSRAGTTWLCKALNEHPQVAAFGESMFFGRNWVEPTGEGRYGPEEIARVRAALLSHGTFLISVIGAGAGCLRRTGETDAKPILDAAIGRTDLRPTPGELFLALARGVAEHEGKTVWVEKTPHHLNWMDRILREVADARFVVMRREPYGFMLSYKHQGDRQIDPIRRAFERRYHPFGCAMVWRGFLRAAREAAERHGDRVLSVEFNDLRSDPGSTLDRVQAFFGLRRVDLANAVPPDNTSFPAGSRPALRGEDYFWLHLVAGSAMRDAGYARKKGPSEPLRVVWSFLRLPIWAAVNLIELRGRTSGSLVRYLARWVNPAKAAA